MPIENTKSRRLEIDGEKITGSELKKRYYKVRKELEDIQLKRYCVVCGRYRDVGNFYKQRNIHYHHEYSHICKDCLFDIIYNKDEAGKRHKPTRESLIKGLCYFNKPFISSLYEDCSLKVSQSLKYETTDFAKLYISKIVSSAYDGMTFANSDIIDIKETRVSDVNEFDSDIKKQLYLDMNDVKDLVGYDPFVQESAADKPFLYSHLLSMLDTEDDADRDAYKIQCCISITRDFLKAKKLDDMSSEMLSDQARMNENIKTFNELVSMKSNLLNSINKTANENGISTKGSGQRGKTDQSFTGKLKKMKDLDLRDSELNGYDLMTCKGMRQVLDMSNESIIKQLKLEDNEYADMVAEQRTMVIQARREADMYQEIMRILLRENIDLKKLISENGISLGNDVVNIEEISSGITTQLKEWAKDNGNNSVPES